jgi:hypothetical protein
MDALTPVGCIVVAAFGAVTHFKTWNLTLQERPVLVCVCVCMCVCVMFDSTLGKDVTSGAAAR